ncbi:MAG: SCP2 sterol-binding domain-containing protein [Proteobacteria bacterium]|nr:SCP2 sterol-binding domain-containing protein [Pseudomonadota bacterium]
MSAISLSPLQPLLRRIVTKVACKRPELFQRLGSHRQSRYLLDAQELPFVFLLVPDPHRPQLRAYLRSSSPTVDVRIVGPLRTLARMADGGIDGDALFFSREFTITGDLEAAVCLRSALDDLEGSIMQDLFGLFGAPGRLLGGFLHRPGSFQQAGSSLA